MHLIFSKFILISIFFSCVSFYFYFSKFVNVFLFCSIQFNWMVVWWKMAMCNLNDLCSACQSFGSIILWEMHWTIVTSIAWCVSIQLIIANQCWIYIGIYSENKHCIRILSPFEFNSTDIIYTMCIYIFLLLFILGIRIRPPTDIQALAWTKWIVIVMRYEMLSKGLWLRLNAFNFISIRDQINIVQLNKIYRMSRNQGVFSSQLKIYLISFPLFNYVLFVLSFVSI